MMNDLMVTMSNADFAAYVRDRYKLEIIENALYNSAKLNYDGKSLVFDERKICPVLEAVEYEAYTDVLTQFQQAELKPDTGDPMN